MKQEGPQTVQNIKDSDWIEFPGGELAGKRPTVLCTGCRAALGQALKNRRTLCFQCYRAGIERDHALRVAGQLDTASVERFQTQLPFEPVDHPRLEMLKVERLAARTSSGVTPLGRFADRRRQAQIAARHALQRIAAGIAGTGAWKPTPADREREIAAAIHAAELQLPESWLPFVVAR